MVIFTTQYFVAFTTLSAYTYVESVSKTIAYDKRWHPQKSLHVTISLVTI